MKKIYNLIKKYRKDCKAATAMEYALLAAGVGLAIVAFIFAVGGDLRLVFSAASDATDSVVERANSG